MRGWIALGAAAFAVLFALLGRAVDSEALYTLSGLASFAAVGIGISMLPLWDRLGWRLPKMRLFPRPGPGEEWDPETGSVRRTRR